MKRQFFSVKYLSRSTLHVGKRLPEETANKALSWLSLTHSDSSLVLPYTLPASNQSVRVFRCSHLPDSQPTVGLGFVLANCIHLLPLLPQNASFAGMGIGKQSSGLLLISSFGKIHFLFSLLGSGRQHSGSCSTSPLGEAVISWSRN